MKSIRSVMQAYAPPKPMPKLGPAKTSKGSAHVGHHTSNLGKFLHPKKGK